jgi:hypothetical protein
MYSHRNLAWFYYIFTSDVQFQPQLPALGNKLLIEKFAVPKMESKPKFVQELNNHWHLWASQLIAQGKKLFFFFELSYLSVLSNMDLENMHAPPLKFIKPSMPVSLSL